MCCFASISTIFFPVFLFHFKWPLPFYTFQWGVRVFFFVSSSKVNLFWHIFAIPMKRHHQFIIRTLIFSWNKKKKQRRTTIARTTQHRKTNQHSVLFSRSTTICLLLTVALLLLLLLFVCSFYALKSFILRLLFNRNYGFGKWTPQSNGCGLFFTGIVAVAVVVFVAVACNNSFQWNSGGFFLFVAVILISSTFLAFDGIHTKIFFGLFIDQVHVGLLFDNSRRRTMKLWSKSTQIILSWNYGRVQCFRHWNFEW